MNSRKASCSCGALSLTCRGEPLSTSICYCYQCQRRTGSAFGAQARFREADVTVHGEPREYTRKGDSGGSVTFWFCGTCGSTVYWQPDGMKGFLVVAVGSFADRNFPAPSRSVYGERRHGWLELSGLELEEYD